MLPTLAEGDFVIAFRWWRSLQAGDLVVVQHLSFPFLIKRIKSIDEHGYLQLQGDGQKSLSPEQIGTILRSQVLGKVIYTSKAS